MNVIIIGGGQVGTYIANLLLYNNQRVIVIENREHVFAKLKKELPHEAILFGNGTDPSILEKAGIKDADVLAAVTGGDETNLVASTIAKFEFGVSRVIARVNNPKNSWLFDASMGVDVGLNQADLLAHIVVEEMDLKNLLTLMKINEGEYSIVQILVDGASGANEAAVKDLEIPDNTILIAISRGKETIIPRGDTVVRAGDHVLALGNLESQVKLNKLFGMKK